MVFIKGHKDFGTPKSRKRQSNKMKGKLPKNLELLKTLSPFQKGHKINLGKKRPPMTEKWKKKISIGRKGKSCGKDRYNWKGGIYFNVYRHYQNYDYKLWRKAVFERDDYTCLNCGVRGVFLHPHHIKSYTYYPEYRYDIDNGITLCVPCHHQLHFGK